jgi:ribosome-associated protein
MSRADRPSDAADRGGEPALPDGHLRLAPGASVHPDALAWTFTGSGGPGGQNVNKRATRAVLRVDPALLTMPAWARARVRALAGSALTEAGELLIASDEHRSQGMNKDACLERLSELCSRAMVRPKIRRKTKPSKGSVERRLTEKKRRGDTKRGRRDSEA